MGGVVEPIMMMVIPAKSSDLNLMKEALSMQLKLW
jgi:hypothetical protein